jgi:glycosyltransferase involved in cell wall biosynthesis
MRIAISAYGKFDLFRWAEGFEKVGLLNELLTDIYSKKNPFFGRWRKDAENVPVEKVKTFFLPRLLQPALRKITGTDYWDSLLFEKWAENHVQGSDIFISRSSCAKLPFISAKKKNIKTVLYRGSSHIQAFEEIRKEEAARWSAKFPDIDKRVVRRELEEYELADAIYLPSSYASKTFIEKGVPREKIVSFPLSAEPVLKRERQPEDFSILYVGSISIYKGVQYLLEAVRIARKEKEIKLILAGSISPEMQPILKKYEGEFEYKGIVPHHEIGKLYEEASAFVFPTIDDGFGQVVIEAMSRGVPVITTANSCGPDVIRDGIDGFVVQPRDPEIIAQKILMFANDPNLLRTASLEAAKVGEKYSIAQFTDKWIEYFKRKQWM